MRVEVRMEAKGTSLPTGLYPLAIVIVGTLGPPKAVSQCSVTNSRGVERVRVGMILRCQLTQRQPPDAHLHGGGKVGAASRGPSVVNTGFSVFGPS